MLGLGCVSGWYGCGEAEHDSTTLMSRNGTALTQVRDRLARAGYDAPTPVRATFAGPDNPPDASLLVSEDGFRGVVAVFARRADASAVEGAFVARGELGLADSEPIRLVGEAGAGSAFVVGYATGPTDAAQARFRALVRSLGDS